jgi:hypothetical protein|eukprot:COSAG01_NODE_3043_length_6676_cov_21.258933_7_plen_70_part_00
MAILARCTNPGQVQRGEALLEANFPEEAELRMNFAALEFGRAQDRGKPRGCRTGRSAAGYLHCVFRGCH